MYTRTLRNNYCDNKRADILANEKANNPHMEYKFR